VVLTAFKGCGAPFIPDRENVRNCTRVPRKPYARGLLDRDSGLWYSVASIEESR